jgi:hypothetical protein
MFYDFGYTRNLQYISYVKALYIVFFTVTQNPPLEHGLIIEDTWSYSDTPHSVGLLWTSDQLVAETYTWQHATLTTAIHAPGEIRTLKPSKRATADQRLRPSGHLDRHYVLLEYWITRRKEGWTALQRQLKKQNVLFRQVASGGDVDTPAITVPEKISVSTNSLPSLSQKGLVGMEGVKTQRHSFWNLALDGGE